MSRRIYTPEQIAFLAENIPGCHFKELTEKFNKHFGTSLTVGAMISLTDRHGLHNGIDAKFNTGWEPTQFKKGHVPANKGKKGVGGWEPTQFKPGNRPKNYRPIGSERITKDGYVEVKIADPNKWRPKHLVIWEATNGPVPKGHVVIFADGNKQHLEIDNLILVSRGELVRLNQNGLINSDADLTRSGILIADIITKCSQRKRESKGRSK